MSGIAKTEITDNGSEPKVRRTIYKGILESVNIQAPGDVYKIVFRDGVTIFAKSAGVFAWKTGDVNRIYVIAYKDISAEFSTVQDVKFE